MAPEEDEAPGRSLDVTSSSFDPLIALYSAATPLPFPDVRCFNNLAEYESFLRRGGRARSRSQRPEKKGRSRPDPERAQRLRGLMLPAEEGDSAERSRPRRGRRPPRNVLTRMAQLEGSPVGRLYRCVRERLRVHVHTRTFRGLRGVCSGFILAFDKCWNLAMVDVDEAYRRPVLGRAFHSQPALTLPRLMARLQLQEAGEAGTAEPGGKPDYQQKGKEKPDYQQRKEKEKPDYQQRKEKEKPDYQQRKEKPDYQQRKEKEKPDCQQRKEKEKPDYQQRKEKEKPDCQQKGKEKPDYQQTKENQQQRKKPDYQRVYTRHMQQVFIRGENVLLVHIPE